MFRRYGIGFALFFPANGVAGLQLARAEIRKQLTGESRMLEQTDRVALAVPDAKQAAAGLNAIFDSEIVDDAVDADAGARRITLQWGRSQLELYEPKEEGPVANFIDQGKRGLFAGGFASSNPAAVAARLDKAGIKVTQQDDRFVVYPHDLNGTGVIMSPIDRHIPFGLSLKPLQV